MQCYKHPDVQTNLSCGKCGKPICPKCLVQTPVGMRCLDCANLKKLPTYQVSTSFYLRAIGAGIVISVVCGFAWWALNLILPFFFLRVFIAAGAGYAIGEIIGLSVNRKRGTGLAIISGACACLSFAIANVFLMQFILGGLMSIIINIIVLAVAIFTAVVRMR